MNGYLEGNFRNLTDYYGNFPERQRKISKPQVSLCPGRVFNRKAHEYELR